MTNDRFKFRWPLLKDRTNRFIEFVYGDCFVGKPFDPPTKHFGEPQQCTGLKDKNGNLIYEGDIVRQISKREPEYEEYITEVKWCVLGYPLYDEESFDYEVIGNIHENKELLDEH